MEAVLNKTFEKYPAYKDSGVEWIGEIPEGWEVNRLKSSIELLTGYPFKSDKYSNQGIKLARGINVKEGYFDWTDVQFWSELTRELERYLLKTGDVLIAMDGSKVGKNFCQVKEDDLPILLLQRVARLRPHRKILPNYLYWNIVNKSFLTWVNISKTDPMVPHIAPKDIENFIVAIPSPPEQTAIARFLDDKTAKIYQAIVQKEKLIALLKERKQIMIQELVTGKKTWNGSAWTEPAEVKDSGVEWIGKIPESWEVTKAKYYSSVFVPERAKPNLSENKQGLPWVTTEILGSDYLKKSNVKYYVAKKDMRLTGSRILKQDSVLATCVGNFGITSINPFDCIVNQQIQAYTDLKIHPLFFMQQIRLSKDYFSNNSTMTTIQYVSKDVFASLPIVLTTLREQEMISNYIESQSSKIDQSISLQEKQIEKLKEYKSTLIDSAVTGKIKVPEL